MAIEKKVATYQAQIMRFLGTLDKTLPSPDQKNNVGRMLGMAFMWDAIASYAKKQSDVWWETLEKEQFIDTATLKPGDHDLCESPHFKAVAKVTKPYKMFSTEKLVDLLKPYKIAAPKARELIEKAYIEGKSRVSLSITERNQGE